MSRIDDVCVDVGDHLSAPPPLLTTTKSLVTGSQRTIATASRPSPRDCRW